MNTRLLCYNRGLKKCSGKPEEGRINGTGARREDLAEEEEREGGFLQKVFTHACLQIVIPYLEGMPPKRYSFLNKVWRLIVQCN